MKSLPVEKLKPGMISAEDIMTKKGQILIKKGDALDSTLITRLAFYEIKRLTVENPNVSQEKPSADRNTEFQPAARAPFRVYQMHNPGKNSLKNRVNM